LLRNTSFLENKSVASHLNYTGKRIQK